MNPYNRLSPFKWFVIQNFPFIEEDFDAITEYQLLCKVIEYLNKNIDKTNELGIKVEELNNWFINLDVQDEIDNKLNEMADSGELAEIINEEIFENLNSEINLLATKVHGTYFENRKYILIGDSYADGYTPDGNVTSWEQLFVNLTGLTNTIQKHLGGTGFVNLVQNKNFQSLLEEVPDDNSVTDIVVLGGYNDINYNKSQITNSITSFIAKANEKFPNANVSIGFVGWCRDSSLIYQLSIACQYYRECCGYYNASYLNNIEYTLHNYFDDFSSDGIHPNLNGQTKIVRNLIQSLMTGSCNNPTVFTQVGVSYDSNVSGTPFGSALTCFQNNNIVSVSLSSQITIEFVEAFDTTGIAEVEIGTINNGYIVGSEYNLTATTVQIIVHDENGYCACIGNIVFRDGKIYLQFSDINDSGNNYRSFTDISDIQISRFSNTFDSLYC